jgi:hypothetical protein
MIITVITKTSVSSLWYNPLTLKTFDSSWKECHKSENMFLYELVDKFEKFGHVWLGTVVTE